MATPTIIHQLNKIFKLLTNDWNRESKTIHYHNDLLTHSMRLLY